MAEYGFFIIHLNIKRTTAYTKKVSIPIFENRRFCDMTTLFLSKGNYFD